MPTVPVIDQTAGGSAPYAAPGVTPERNFQPQQQIAQGEAMQQAGEMAMRTGQTIGDRLAEQVDEAKVKQAETAFLGAKQKILYDPETGYLNQRGENAVNAFQPAKEALDKAAKDATAGLTNSLQQRMIQLVMNSHLLDAGQTMAIHNHGQTVAMAAGAAKERADSLMLEAFNNADSRTQVDDEGKPSGKFAALVKNMTDETVKSAALAGQGPDSPLAKSLLREQMSKLYDLIIRQKLDADDAQGASQIFNEEKDKGNLDAETIRGLGGQIRVATDRQKVALASDKHIKEELAGGSNPVAFSTLIPGGSVNVTDVMGSPRADGRKHNGIDIAVPSGTPLLAPADGTVTKVWSDDKFGGGLSVEMKFANGYTAGVAHLSASNVHVGDQVKQGTQFALSGRSGNATGDSVHYMMKDEKGNYIDPRNASQPQPSKSAFNEPTQLLNVMGRIEADDTLTAKQKDQARSNVEQKYNENRAIQNEQEAGQFKDAKQQFFAGGEKVSAISPTLLNALPAEKQQYFKDSEQEKALKDFHIGQAFKEMSDTALVSWFYQNQDELTPERVNQAYGAGKLPNSTYLGLLNRAEELKAAGPKGVATAQAIQGRVDFWGDLAGINMRPHTEADYKTFYALNQAITLALAQEREANHGKVTNERAEAIIKQQTSQYVTATRPHAAWNPFVAMGIESNDPKKKFVFQMPDQTKWPKGATQVVPNKDGTMHYFDANRNDLGQVQ